MKSWITRALVLAMLLVCVASIATAQESHPSADPAVAPMESASAGHPTEARTEANLVLPGLGSVQFMGVNGRTVLMFGLIVCVLGLIFGAVIYTQLKNLPVHSSMREISELIYA